MFRGVSLSGPCPNCAGYDFAEAVEHDDQVTKALEFQAEPAMAEYLAAGKGTEPTYSCLVCHRNQHTRCALPAAAPGVAVLAAPAAITAPIPPASRTVRIAACPSCAQALDAALAPQAVGISVKGGLKPAGKETPDVHASSSPANAMPELGVPVGPSAVGGGAAGSLPGSLPEAGPGAEPVSPDRPAAPAAAAGDGSASPA